MRWLSESLKEGAAQIRKACHECQQEQDCLERGDAAVRVEKTVLLLGGQARLQKAVDVDEPLQYPR
jgi:hypothetical protein